VAFPGTHVGVVDSLAADLIYFIGSMQIPRSRVTSQVGLILGGIAAAVLLMALSPMTRAGFQAGCPASGPCPTPTPVGANLILDTAAGGPSTRITVNGSLFLANESMTLYWDTASHVATSVTADGSGNFTTSVKPFPGDSPGQHRLCASVQPNPCANFTLQGAPTPTPPSAPSPSASPSASPSPTPSTVPLVVTANSGQGALDVITRPPLVFLPIIALLAILAALAYWFLMRVDRPPVLPSASVVHRSARPEVGPALRRPPESPPAAPDPAPPAMQPPPPELPPPPAPLEAADGGAADAPEPPSY
jgi:hypothetical protein